MTTADRQLEQRLVGALHEIGSLAPRGGFQLDAAHAHSTEVRPRRVFPMVGAAASIGVIIGAGVLVGGVGSTEGDSVRSPSMLDGTTASSSAAPGGSGTRQAVDRTATRLAALEDMHGFGRTVVDYSTATVTLYWKGSLPEDARREVAAAPAGVAVSVVEAPFSAAELAAAGQRLLDASHSGRWGGGLTAAIPTQDLTGLRVETIHPDQAPVTELSAVAGVPVLEVRDSGPVQELDG